MANNFLLTDDGRQAIADALADGTPVSPKTFKFIVPIMNIDATFSASNIPSEDVWFTGTITEYSVDDAATVSFNCIVEANLATDQTGTVGLYLEDGTLFAICALASQLPINQRQGVYLRLNHDSLTTAFNFNFLSVNNYLEKNSSLFIGTTEVQLDRVSGSLVLNDVEVTNAQKLGGYTAEEIKDQIVAGAGDAYDTLLELQNEIQSNDVEIAGLIAGAIQDFGVLDDNSDLDDVLSRGKYSLDATYTYVNHATSVSGDYILEVFIGSSDTIYQRITTDDGIFIRGRHAGTWTAWSKTLDASAFQSDLNESGYVIIPTVDGNIIKQWGYLPSSSSGTITVTLPIAFPNNIFMVMGGPNALDFGQDGNSTSAGKDGTSLSTILVTMDGDADTSWIAIGN